MSENGTARRQAADQGGGGSSEDRRPARAFADWNEEMAQRYDIERYYERAHPIVRAIEALRIRALLALARPIPGERVLEVGCGAGHVLERFASCACVGIDLSTGMLDRIRRRLGDAVHLARASGDALPFPDGAFPIVICTEVLEHVPDPHAVMGELLRVAGPGGRVVVSIPNEGAIDRAKRLIRRTPGVRRALATLAAEDNEWHLHRMNRRFLYDIIDGRARVERLRAVPLPLLPIRYAARLVALDRRLDGRNGAAR